MRPINQTAGDTRAVMWKNDSYGQTFERLAVSRDLHRFAGTLSWSCTPKRSAVSGGYFAEMNQYLGQGRSALNVKLGTGPTPVHAALDGYRQVLPELAPLWAAYLMEIEIEMLRRAYEAAALLELRLDQTLDGLTALIRSYNVPLPALPGEDDDL